MFSKVCQISASAVHTTVFRIPSFIVSVPNYRKFSFENACIIKLCFLTCRLQTPKQLNSILISVSGGFSLDD